MTSRSILSVRSVRSALILLVIALFPATAWLQEPAAVSPAPPQQPAAASTPAPAAEQSGKYDIRQGDTLWDIANALYRDPFLWPLIWKSNPSISDPDLIFPGTALVIPSLAPVERAMNAPEEKVIQEKAVETTEPVAPAAVQAAAPDVVPQEESSSPSIFRQRISESAAAGTGPALATGSNIVLPEDSVKPIMDKYAMLRAGFISEEPSKDYLEGSVEDKAKGSQSGNLVSFDQEVFIVVRSRETVNVGDRFVIYEEVHDVKHPITGRYFGKLYKVNGILKVTGTKEKNVYIARITLSFDAAVRGNLLAPYQEPTPIYSSAQKQAKNLRGHILEVTDQQSVVGQTYVVYLDKGKEDGVDAGDRFTVISEPSPQTGVRRPIAEVLVYIVKARTSTAIVVKSADAISKGYPVVFKE